MKFIGEATYSQIKNCYSTGDVSSTTTSGGFIGSGDSAVIKNCYVTGNVKSTAAYGDAGGLIGDDFGDSEVINSYRSSSQSVSASGYVNNDYGVSKALSTIKTVDFHSTTLGWSADIWTFTEGEFPQLKKAGN